MAGRFKARVRVLPRALWHSVRPRHRPAAPRRVLVVHHLLLGDTLMLTPLLAKLRALHPGADLVMTVPPAYAPLFQHRPYGVRALPYAPHRPETLPTLFREAGFDLAVVPGDGRYAWLARALNARWVTAFAGDPAAYRNWPVDERVPYPPTPGFWGDLVAGLVAGPPPPPYQAADWTAPDARPFDLPGAPYAVLHVGASSATRFWPARRWSLLARHLSARGLNVVWSGGPGEESLVAGIPGAAAYPSYAGRLDLPQLWRLLRHARLLVCPDTGVAHLGKVVGVPTVALFGPGDLTLFGRGKFWADSPYRAVAVADVACRNQRLIFKVPIPWAQHCARGLRECPTPRCMLDLTLEAVLAAVAQLLGPATGPTPVAGPVAAGRVRN